MRNFLTVSLFALVVGMGTTSCATMKEWFVDDPIAVTTDNQLKEGEKPAAVIPKEQLPEELQAVIPEGTQVVLAEKEQLQEGAAYVPLGKPEGVDIAGIIQAIFGVAAAFFPSLAAWEGIVALFSQRKRQQYAKAFTSIMPFDNKIDIGGAMSALAAAIGAAHSTKQPQPVPEQECSQTQA